MIEEPIRRASELPLEKEDIESLERQDKQLQIVIEELKALQQNHWKCLRQCRQRLRVRDVAEKVLSAIKSRNSTGVTGSDMYQLLKLLAEDDLFTNLRQVT